MELLKRLLSIKFTVKWTLAGHPERLQQWKPSLWKCYWPRSHRLYQCCPSTCAGKGKRLKDCQKGQKSISNIYFILPKRWHTFRIIWQERSTTAISFAIRRVVQVNADTSTLNTHVWFVMQVRASLQRHTKLCDMTLHFLQNQHLRAKHWETYLILLCHLSGRIADFDGQPQTMKMLARWGKTPVLSRG